MSRYVKRSGGSRVAQLEEARAVNHAVDRSSPSCVKLAESLQQTSNFKIAESFESIPKLKSLCATIISWVRQRPSSAFCTLRKC